MQNHLKIAWKVTHIVKTSEHFVDGTVAQAGPSLPPPWNKLRCP